MLKLREGVVVMRMDENALLVDTRTGRYMALNQVADAMIEAMLASADESDAVSSLEEIIAADSRTLRADIQALFKRLVELELVA